MSKNLLDLLEEDKIELKKSGNGRWVASCPFHQGDRNPSFTVFPTDSYFCFGCQEWGDAVKWLIDFRKMTVSQAFEYVGSDYSPRQKPKVIKIKNMARTYPFLADVANMYHEFLFDHVGAMTYLKGRGLTSDTIIKYKIGYTDGRVLNIQNSLEYELAQQVGILTDKGYERLTHRITIPNLVNKSWCDYIMGRTVLNDKMKYLGTGGHKPLQGLWEARHAAIWFLVEGHFDWLLMRQWGLPAVAIGGSHTTRDNLNILKTKKVILVPDNDDEGQKAAQLLIDKLPDLKVLDYAALGAKDIGELALMEGGKDKFMELVRSQFDWLNTYTLGTIFQDYSLTSIGITASL